MRLHRALARALTPWMIAAVLWSGATPSASAATIIIVDNDGAGEGFKDPTPAAPVGGNPGTTRGAQRLFVFQTAANLWGAILTSPVTIRVQAQFNPLFCDPSSATLGSAGTVAVAANFPNAEFANTNYPIALANRLAGSDLDPGANDISCQFNSTLDGGACLGGQTWYYGVDGNEPANKVELLPVVMHELGHGLGFAQFANLSTGALFNNRPDVYNRFLYDNSNGLTWAQMSNAQRAASAVNTRRVGWNGAVARAVAATTLGPRVDVRVDTPAGIAGAKIYGTAQFGPAVSSSSVSGQVVLVNDGVSTTSDGCSPIVNSVSGRIALFDRGGCDFVLKAQAAQAAGAIAAVVANNVSGAPPQMGGSDPSLSIPTVSISQADGDAIKSALGGGAVTMTIGPVSGFLAGADDLGRPLVYTPNPLEPGSSISHFDVTATPDLLMEPFINDGLSSGVDLTRYVFEDIGWFQPRTTDTSERVLPAGLRLAAARPNPFAATTTIAFDLARDADVTVDVFDPMGRTVRRLAAGPYAAGTVSLTWDGTDDRGKQAGAGVYFVRVRAGSEVAVRRAVYVASGN